jgi:hypothetical protein
MVELVRAGLATATGRARRRAGRKAMQITRVKITEAWRRPAARRRE